MTPTLLGDDFFRPDSLGRRVIRVLRLLEDRRKAIVNRSVRHEVVIISQELGKPPGLGVGDVVPDIVRLVTTDQLFEQRIRVPSVFFTLRNVFVQRLPRSDGLLSEAPVQSSGEVDPHVYALPAHRGRQLTDDVPLGALLVGPPMRIAYLARPQPEAIVMSRRRHDVARANILEELRPAIRN